MRLVAGPAKTLLEFGLRYLIGVFRLSVSYPIQSCHELLEALCYNDSEAMQILLQYQVFNNLTCTLSLSPSLPLYPSHSLSLYLTLFPSLCLSLSPSPSLSLSPSPSLSRQPRRAQGPDGAISASK